MHLVFNANINRTELITIKPTFNHYYNTPFNNRCPYTKKTHVHPVRTHFSCLSSGNHNRSVNDSRFLGYDAVSLSQSLPTFRRNMVPSSLKGLWVRRNQVRSRRRAPHPRRHDFSLLPLPHVRNMTAIPFC